ncbi:MAG: hypothetical protein ACK55Z_37730, partial [bacterium]
MAAAALLPEDRQHVGVERGGRIGGRRDRGPGNEQPCHAAMALAARTACHGHAAPALEARSASWRNAGEHVDGLPKPARGRRVLRHGWRAGVH